MTEPWNAGPVWALGTMSGTSLDGVDAALLRTDGETIFEFGPSDYRAYSEAERAVLRAALGRWDGLGEAARVVETAHCEVLSGLTGFDLIGFHGQTTAHDPRGRGTCQIGDGRLLAHMLDCPVVWDFRSADVAAGGQGAPLAPFYHHACARSFRDDAAPVAFLNLGGVGNVTWVDPGLADPAAPGACLAFDTGPANAPLNDLLRARRKQDFDADGALAAEGTVANEIIGRLKDHPYVLAAPPKSLDRDDFSWLAAAVAELSDADAAATLTAAVAETVGLAAAHFPQPPARLYVTGGGRANPVMMAMISARLACDVVPVEVLGLDGDMLEAQAFAYLAVRAARGLATSARGTTGVGAPVCGGVLSWPDDAAQMLAGRAI